MGGNFSALKEFKEFHPNGQIRKHEFYQNGQLEGTRKEWHDNGQLYVQEESYREGKLHGKRKEWHEDGRLKKETSYLIGAPFYETSWIFVGNLPFQHEEQETKQCKLWDLSGRHLWKHEIYYPNNIYESKTWYGNGHLNEHAIYFKQLLIRFSESWRDNGRPQSRECYKDGKKEGEWIYWNPNDPKNIRRFYRDGIPIVNDFTVQKKMIVLALRRKLYFLKYRYFSLDRFIINDLTNFILNK